MLEVKAAAPVVANIVDSGRDNCGRIVGDRKPSMALRLRFLSNVPRTPKKAYFDVMGKEKERALAVSIVSAFAQTLRLVALSTAMDEHVPAKLKHPEKVPALTAREPR